MDSKEWAGRSAWYEHQRQLDDATTSSAWHAGGRGFKSRPVHQTSDQTRSATFGDLCKDCLLLLSRIAKTRVFVVTDPTVYGKLLETPYAQICLAKGIRLLDKRLRL